MASVEQHVEQEIVEDGGEATAVGAQEPVEAAEQAPSEAPPEAAVASAPNDEIPVENPATGETVRTVPDLDAAAVAEMAARARAAQPQWEAYGFEGRARVLRRAQKWLMDNAQRVTETIVSETGKTYEDANLAEIGYAGNAFGFWAKEGPGYLADEAVKSSQVLVKGKKLILRYRPLGLIGVIGPWNYPLTNSFGDCIPALMAGNSVILKPSEITPLTSLLMAEGLRECGLPENVFQVATGRGATGAALIERGRHDHVHRFHQDRKKGRRGGCRSSDPRVARARRQGPDDRALRRRPRARGQLRDLFLDAERRSDVHLDRARVRRGAGLRRVRGKGLREGTCAACRQVRRRLRHRRGGGDHIPAADARRSRTTSTTPCRRAHTCSRVAKRCPAPGASTSRPCSSTSITR